MLLVGDESVDHPILLRLREEGHTVWAVAEQEPGLTDEQVLDEARRQDALLFTSDKDFGALIFHQRLVSSGVVLARLKGLNADQKAERVAQVFREHEQELRHAFTVIRPDQVRIRPLKPL